MLVLSAMQPNVLILGGTTEARELATALFEVQGTKVQCAELFQVRFAIACARHTILMINQRRIPSWRDFAHRHAAVQTQLDGLEDRFQKEFEKEFSAMVQGEVSPPKLNAPPQTPARTRHIN